MKTERRNPLEIVAANVAACMKSGRGPDSQLQLGKKIKGGQSTIGRILSGTTSPRIDTLDRIAAQYCLEAWQLLVPDLDPQNPPVLRSISPAEAALYERLRETAESLAAIKKQ